MRDLRKDNTGISGWWGGLLMIVAAIVLLAFVGLFSLIIFPVILIYLVKTGKMSLTMALAILIALFIIGAAFFIGILAVIFSSGWETTTEEMLAWLI